MPIRSSQLAADCVASGTEMIIAVARVDIFHGPGTPYFLARKMRLDAAAEHKVTRGTGNGRHAFSVLLTHFVVADVSGTGSDAVDSEVVIAGASVAR